MMRMLAHFMTFNFGPERRKKVQSSLKQQQHHVLMQRIPIWSDVKNGGFRLGAVSIKYGRII
jgi:hypothetical protein